MKTIIFDQKSLCCSKDDERSRTFIELQKGYLKEKLRFRGYIYLNEVYESLGVEWNPDDENVCYRKGDDFVMEIQPTGNGTCRINIH